MIGGPEGNTALEQEPLHLLGEVHVEQGGVQAPAMPSGIFL